MSFRLALSVPLLVAALAGCGKPVPPEKADYVGEWQRPEMYLLITQDGSVRYKRIKGGATTSVEGPLKSFEGDNFTVGVGPMTTTFEVSVRPHQTAEGEWRMTVDGLELLKTQATSGQ
jgi:hypothetical protein